MKVTIGGDFSPKYRLSKLIDDEKYSEIFGEVKDLFRDSDFSIVNFESTIPSVDDKAIVKVGPNLQCSPKSIEALLWAGVNVVTLANNHAGDFGPRSLINTVALLDKSEIRHVGAGENLNEANKALYLEKGNEVLAVINCCEHEYGIVTDDRAGTNPLNPIGQYYAIKEAKEKADYVLVIVHGGAEGFQLPTPRMQDTYRFFIDAGADAVINHHQHCYSGREVYKGKPIYYGLGNLAFDYPVSSKKWTEGIIVTLELSPEHVKHNYTPYVQFDENNGVRLIKDTSEYDKKINELSAIISDRQQLKKQVTEYFNSWESTIRTRLEPYSGRILQGLYSRKLLPSLLTKSKIRLMQNLVNCETHRERLQHFLDNN